MNPIRTSDPYADAMTRIAELERENALLKEANSDVRRIARQRDMLRARVKSFLARCEATEGQAFYDRVKPEMEAVNAALEP